MYDNEFETKENKIWTKDEIEPQQKCVHQSSHINYTFFISFVLFAGSSFYNKSYLNPNKVEKNSSGLKVSMGLKDRKKYEIEDWVTRNKKLS